MVNGETVKAANNDEELCFQVIRDLDHVGSHVHGSISSKKHMCNEIWSLIARLGAPLWYITLSPADNRHPICLYFADTKQEFHPFSLAEDVRYCLIAENPIAGASFFDFMANFQSQPLMNLGSTTMKTLGPRNSLISIR